VPKIDGTRGILIKLASFCQRCTSSASKVAVSHQRHRPRAGAWRTLQSGTRGCRRSWTARSTTVSTAAPSNRARHASIRTPRSIAHASSASTATTKTRGQPGHATSTAPAPPIVYQPQTEFTLVSRLLLRAHSWMVSKLTGIANPVLQRSETACSRLPMPERLRLKLVKKQR
jgi:hypothetical protein